MRVRASTRRPVILLLFANDRLGDDSAYLRNLPDECRRLERMLGAVADRYEVVPRQNVTRASLFEIVRTYRHRTVGVHFGGHAHPDALMIEDDAGRPVPLNMPGLAGRLGAMSHLRWVFLNGCGTEAQVEALHARASVTAIVTECAILDTAAVEFAEEFYASLTVGATLHESFEAARDRLLSLGEQSQDSRRMLRPGAARSSTHPPWRIVPPSGRPDAVHWRLVEPPTAVEIPAIGTVTAGSARPAATARDDSPGEGARQVEDTAPDDRHPEARPGPSPLAPPVRRGERLIAVIVMFLLGLAAVGLFVDSLARSNPSTAEDAGAALGGSDREPTERQDFGGGVGPASSRRDAEPGDQGQAPTDIEPVDQRPQRQDTGPADAARPVDSGPRVPPAGDIKRRILWHIGQCDKVRAKAGLLALKRHPQHRSSDLDAIQVRFDQAFDWHGGSCKQDP